MFIGRIVIRNFRNFEHFDIALGPGTTCVLGENNTGKTNLLHALRLVLDANLSSQYRQLIEHDIHSAVDLSSANQVLVSVEFTDYIHQENQTALVGMWEVDEDSARLTYRFRPRQPVREAIGIGEQSADDLTPEDYHWELTGGGPNDPATVNWDEELGASVRFGDLQQFQVVMLQALRNVEQDLRQSRLSPLRRILDASDITADDKTQLVGILRNANLQIAETDPIQLAGEAIQQSYSSTAGEAHDIGVKIGMSDPSFASIARSLTVLLTNESLSDFEPSRNGLGLNNVLYISMVLEYFERRVANPNMAGQLLLMEEPEAHLHPQLQRVLYRALSQKPFQTILTTHSTHISSQAPLTSVIALTNPSAPAVASTSPARDGELSDREIADLERYLDATRSTLLFARSVILVEGPSELFLIPELVRHSLGIDLDRLGVSVIPIYGRHFDVYAKLFADDALPKRCAIIADADLPVANSAADQQGDDPAVEPFDAASLESGNLRVFLCETTFEREITIPETLPMLSEAAAESGATASAQRLRDGYDKLHNAGISQAEQEQTLEELREIVLRTARRVGKARFAQIASKHASLAESVPDYIGKAVSWVVSK